MSGPSKVKEFPDISNKLNAPVKKSLFERQKAEAEAKRRREEAENAAVFAEFAASFEDEEGGGGDHGAGRSGSMDHNQPGGMTEAALGNTPKRHFTTTSTRASGPGTLGPAPQSTRKRALDGSLIQPKNRSDDPYGYYEESSSRHMDARTAFQAEQEHDNWDESSQDGEEAIPKPTLQLSSLPMTTSEGVVRALLPPNLTVDHVEILTLPFSGGLPSLSAIVTLAKDTSGKDIDDAVTNLQKKYLGCAYYLSISRHLSSAAIGSATNLHSSGPPTLPFGAKIITNEPANTLSRAPPPAHRGGIAPPAAYSGGYPRQQNRQPPAMVYVSTPTDLRQLRIINMTIERIVKYGEEIEAVLMNNPEVQHDEDWAFLWDSCSTSGVYYRYRLWSILSGAINDEDLRNRAGVRQEPVTIFQGQSPWMPPSQHLQFEFSTYFDEFVSDPEYDSDVEGESDDEAPKRPTVDAAVVAGLEESTERTYLNPLQKSRLTHLFARLPTSTARLRRGDVARVTNFAISHASQADEIVRMLLMNVEMPFVRTSANPDYDPDMDYSWETDYYSDEDSEDDRDEPADVMESIEAAYDAPKTEDEKGKEKETDKEQEKDKEKDDPSSAKLIALYLISDILSAAASAGVRNAWKYRPGFEKELKDNRTFERLGKLENEMSWGKIKADRWKASVMNVLQLWESWSVFSDASQKAYTEQFKIGEVEKAKAEKERKEKEERSEKVKQWRAAKEKDSVERRGSKSKSAKDVVPEPIIDESAELDIYDEVVPDRATEEAHVQTSESVKPDTSPPKRAEPVAEKSEKTTGPASRFDVGPTRAAEARRNRPKAVDMFADDSD